MAPCNIAPNQLLQYFFHELPDADYDRLHRHVQACPSCRALLADWRNAIDAYEDFSSSTPAPPQVRIPGPAVSRKRQWMPANKIARRWRPLAIAAAIALMIFLGRALLFHPEDRWSLENSWVAPYEAPLKAYEKNLKQMENDPFFRLN